MTRLFTRISYSELGLKLDSDRQFGDYYVYRADGSEHLKVPEGFPLLLASFQRVGVDLVLVGGDGGRVVIIDYFAHAEPPALLTVTGALLDASLVRALAGPLSPGQFAQLGAAPAIPIGKVATVEGAVTATRADGSQVSLALDDPVSKGT